MTSDNPFANYHRWQKSLLKANPKLPRGCNKAMLVAYCFTMASHGANGIGCFAGDRLIMEELDIKRRETVLKYRHLAVELGWLAPNGKSANRVQQLDIAIPKDSQVVRFDRTTQQSPVVRFDRTTSCTVSPDTTSTLKGTGKIACAIDHPKEFVCSECVPTTHPNYSWIKETGCTGLA